MENSLQHYGVLGMRWGVHKNPGKAFGKSMKKLSAIDKKIDSTRVSGSSEKYSSARLTDKAKKYKFKEEKYRSKAQRALTNRGYEKNTRKADRYSRGHARIEYRAAKNAKKSTREELRSARLERKAHKWVDSMNSVFEGITIDNISAQDISVGQKYCLEMIERYKK